MFGLLLVTSNLERAPPTDKSPVNASLKVRRYCKTPKSLLSFWFTSWPTPCWVWPMLELV